MVRKNLLQLIFSGACLWRWNDKLRPVELSEIEKQAHKMLVACALWHESAKEWEPEAAARLCSQIIEGALFDYFYRLVITDIKPPVFYRICENRQQYLLLTEHVHKSLEPYFMPLGDFWRRMREWHLDETDSPARSILRAAHLYASQWEFFLIRPSNSFDEEMDSIAASFSAELGAYAHLPGMRELLDKSHALGKFANLCGQLRFQIRWTQTPRMPATSVLGHMFVVAALAYFFSLSLGFGRVRRNNSFFSGLFHDFPEVLTRDIISPVKQSVPGLAAMIKKYERQELERRVLKPLRSSGLNDFANRAAWYLGLDGKSEFGDCCRVGGEVLHPAGLERLSAYDKDEHDPRDGQLIKACDLLAAFLEAHESIRNGVASPQLLEGRVRIKQALMGRYPECLRLDALLADFD